MSAELDGELTQQEMALETLRALAHRCADDKATVFSPDWGFGSATLSDDTDAHTHIGAHWNDTDEENFAWFVKDLYGQLVKHRGLNWVKKSDEVVDEPAITAVSSADATEYTLTPTISVTATMHQVIDDKVAAETRRCAGIVQASIKDGEINRDRNRLLELIISEIRGAN